MKQHALKDTYIEYYSWVPIEESIPKSFKTMPGWIKPKADNGVDLVWLSYDEKYFVSVDNKRVYQIDEVAAWTTLVVPQIYIGEK